MRTSKIVFKFELKSTPPTNGHFHLTWIEWIIKFTISARKMSRKEYPKKSRFCQLFCFNIFIVRNLFISKKLMCQRVWLQHIYKFKIILVFFYNSIHFFPSWGQLRVLSKPWRVMKDSIVSPCCSLYVNFIFNFAPNSSICVFVGGLLWRQKVLPGGVCVRFLKQQ